MIDGSGDDGSSPLLVDNCLLNCYKTYTVYITRVPSRWSSLDIGIKSYTSDVLTCHLWSTTTVLSTMIQQWRFAEKTFIKWKVSVLAEQYLYQYLYVSAWRKQKHVPKKQKYVPRDQRRVRERKDLPSRDVSHTVSETKDMSRQWKSFLRPNKCLCREVQIRGTNMCYRTFNLLFIIYFWRSSGHMVLLTGNMYFQGSLQYCVTAQIVELISNVWCVSNGFRFGETDLQFVPWSHCATAPLQAAIGTIIRNVPQQRFVHQLCNQTSHYSD